MYDMPILCKICFNSLFKYIDNFRFKKKQLPVSRCPNGFRGSYCELKCSFPFFGQGCVQRCLCAEEDCHYSTGCNKKRKNYILF